MNPIIRKYACQMGLLVSVIQVCITLYLYYYGSFVDPQFGWFIILINILFALGAILIIKKKQQNMISLREAFSGYFITILLSVGVSILFYVSFFQLVATESKKGVIKKELLDFQLQNFKDYHFTAADIQKNIELSKDIDPFSLSNALQSSLKFILIYCVLGILFSFFIKNKSTFQEKLTE